ncbi:MAG: LysR family transcriptional regulator [Thiohalomonadaceae bacterium]
MDRFQCLTAFVTVVEAGSLSAAAGRLNVAKSVVSRRISELEAHLGVRLLHRTTRRLVLTDAGQTFYRRAAEILAELAEAEHAAAEGRQALTGRVRLSAPLSFGLLHLNPALTAFAEQHPGVQLDVDLNDRAVNLVEEGFDLAVRIGHLEDSSLVARPLAPIRTLLCASPGYLARRGMPRRPRDLAGHDGLVYTNVPEAQQWRFTDAKGNTESVRVPVRLRANNGDLLLEAAAAGLGIVATPTFIAYRAVLEGRLVPLLTDYRLPAANAYAVYPTRRFLPRRVRALVEFLGERFGAQPYWDEGLS